MIIAHLDEDRKCTNKRSFCLIIFFKTYQSRGFLRKADSRTTFAAGY